MPDLAEPPTKKSFAQIMAEGRPKNKTELDAAAASGTPTAVSPQPPAAAAAPSLPAIAPPDDKKPTAAPPAPPTPAPAVDPDDEILSGKRSPKAEDFRRVKQGRDEAKKLADELKTKAEKAEAYEKELGELRKRPVHNAEIIKKIEAERDDFKGKYEAFVVQFTPEFQAKFDGQINSVVENLKLSVGESAGKLVDVLQLPESDSKKKMLAELTEEMDQFQIAEIAAANREMRRIKSERQESITKANQTLSSIHESRRKQAEEQSSQSARVFEENLAKVAAALPVYQKKDGDDDWNKGVEERTRVARAIFEGKFDDENEKAQASFWSAAAPGLLNTWKTDVAARDAKIAELTSTIEKLQGANPTLGSGAGNNAKRERGGFMERVRETTTV